jgi:hypothetical protein
LVLFFKKEPLACLLAARLTIAANSDRRIKGAIGKQAAAIGLAKAGNA